MEKSRVIPLDGVHNFRDYGGYPVEGGGRVKSGLLFRSGQHLEATDADLAGIERLRLKHIIDMRGASERSSYPCRRADTFSASVVFYDGETAALAPHVEAASGALDDAAVHKKMERLYSRLPTREPVLWIMRRYFELLAQGDGATLVHCLAGKDRTGMAVALLHHALGVHPDDAMEDFLLTNTAGNIDARIEAGASAVREKWGNISDSTIRVLMGVDASYLLAMRKAVEEAHGSLDAFLRDVLEVDDKQREALRLHLIEA
ncbi:tyrosine-protein phosphatase [Pontixanthobacter gangjinensis]|uniref:Protein-tyrosine-phosphatase n=1 Tax=Pontixanthobacter gangjinensis TaxID=1028742 RepID=A0A6I4SQ18_9SPHN|nr:tyrosine-protein phosphatase [Pontixanthobacter gangjinensis]MXO57250.1 protein-tyrosine-phosphatase [Pontixanthobacter gangjinensis]